MRVPGTVQWTLLPRLSRHRGDSPAGWTSSDALDWIRWLSRRLPGWRAVGGEVVMLAGAGLSSFPLLGVQVILLTILALMVWVLWRKVL